MFFLVPLFRIKTSKKKSYFVEDDNAFFIRFYPLVISRSVRNHSMITGFPIYVLKTKRMQPGFDQDMRDSC